MDATDISTNPQLVSLDSITLDLHLTETSPCIDAGEALSSFSWDIEGNDRPRGGGWDIGAYESPYTEVISEDKSTTPNTICLHISPNPFNSSCAITASSGATIEIYDLNGKCVGAGLAPAQQQGDRKSRPYIWRPDESISSGVYLIRATAGDRTITKRAILMK